MMTDIKTKAQKVLDAWGDAPFQIHDLIDVLRALVIDNEEWVDGTYMVKSEDILNIATELEKL